MSNYPQVFELQDIPPSILLAVKMVALGLSSSVNIPGKAKVPPLEPCEGPEPLQHNR